jgi:hypothetical protein
VTGDRVRRVLVIVMVLGILVPYTMAAALFWGENQSVLSSTDSERQGVTYLRPVIVLLAAATDQQSSDVAGTPGNGQALRAAIRDVDAVDAQLGEALGTRDRWANARTRLVGMLDSAPTPSVAFSEFGQAVDLVVALIGAVADRSQLILDPDLDTYYLMDATVLRIPAIVVAAGRISDLGRHLDSGKALSLAIMASGMITESSNMATSLRKSFAATQTGAVTPGLVSALDSFSDAATGLVPGLAISQGTSPMTGPQLMAQRQRLLTTSLSLETAGLTQLDNQLAIRRDQLSMQRWLLVGSTVGGLLLAGFGWWLLRRRTSRPHPSEGVPSEGVPSAGVPAARAGAGAQPSGFRAAAGAGSVGARESWTGGVPAAGTQRKPSGATAGAGPGDFSGLIGGHGDDLARRGPS